MFFVCCSISFAQNYVPFPTTNAVWRGQKFWIDGSLSQLIAHELEYHQVIAGDTTINGMTYHKLEETSLENAYNYPIPIIISTTYNGTYYTGAFREDSSKRIFFLRNGSVNEDLLYDFNLAVGDSFQSSLTQQYYLHITAIDSFYDGFIYRKKLILDNSLSDFLIEGIGSSFGLNDFLLHFLEGYFHLYCFKENNIIKYTDSVHNCSLVNIKENQSQQSSFTLSPNPTTEILNVKSEQTLLFPLELFVMDMQGKLMAQKIIHNNDDLSLNVKSFSKGEYLLAVKNKENVLFHGIFCKQ